ncbi:hypothetical protein HY750_03430 [Candidatus Kuenenbacteria bacterium]|nr:hypothetical protein [Candidatus Kuenenbacteria bacterium]
MTIKEFEKQIKNLIKLIDKKIKMNSPELITCLKITEELGELSDVIIGLNNGQRKRKKFSEKKMKEKLETEIADVIGTTFILATRLNVDVEKALLKKLNVEKKRWEKE